MFVYPRHRFVNTWNSTIRLDRSNCSESIYSSIKIIRYDGTFVSVNEFLIIINENWMIFYPWNYITHRYIHPTVTAIFLRLFFANEVGVSYTYSSILWDMCIQVESFDYTCVSCIQDEFIVFHVSEFCNKGMNLEDHSLHCRVLIKVVVRECFE